MSKPVGLATALLTAQKELSADDLVSPEAADARQAIARLVRQYADEIIDGSLVATPQRSWDEVAARLTELFESFDRLEETLTTRQQLGESYELLRCFANLIRAFVSPVAQAKHKNYDSSIGKRNDTQRALALRAAEIAGDLWAADLEKQLLLSRMAEQVLERLSEELQSGTIEGHLNQEGDLQAVQKWIRPVAPEYARKRGRPKGAKDAH